jgi:ADP-heptose:LPS heptosyltransferase
MRHPRVLLHSLVPLAPTSLALLDDLLPEYFVPPQAQQDADRILATSAPDTRAQVVMAPGALASEAWPASHFASLARWLIDQHGATVWLVGGPSDRELLSDVLRRAVSQLREPLHAKIRIVQETLGIFAALVRRAHLVVANDSAPIHFADCFGYPRSISRATSICRTLIRSGRALGRCSTTPRTASLGSPRNRRSTQCSK